MLEVKKISNIVENYRMKLCECKTPSPFMTESSIICKNCGVDLTKHYGSIYDDAPRRIYSEQDRNMRSNNEPVKNKFLSRTTYCDKNDFTGKRLNYDTVQMFRRIYREDTFFVRNNLSRVMGIVNAKLYSVNQTFSFPKHILEDAKKLMKKVIDNKLLRGRSIDLFISTCLYESCLKNREMITYNDILASFNVEKRSFFRAYAIMKSAEQVNEIFDFNYVFKKNLNIYTNYIVKFSNLMEIPNNIISELVILFKKIYKKLRLCGRSRIGIVGTFIYLACNNKLNYYITQIKIAKVCKVSEVTIRNDIPFLKPIIEET